MGTVFQKLVQISLMANWLILAVIVLRLLLKRAPKGITCLLWAVVALRLVFPFSIESPVSMIPQTTSEIQEAVDTTLIHPEPVTSDTSQAPAQRTPDGDHTAKWQPASVIPVVWCIGATSMLGYLLFSCFRMRRLVREAIPETGNIWICDAVATPFILDLIRPRIYLPSGLSGPNRGYVIAHEQCHLRWKDHWWKPLAFILLSVYWFDPFAWLAYVLLCRDIEFACDERVVCHYGMAEKKAYSAALLACSTEKRLVLACPVAFGENAVVQRVRSVLNYKRPRFWVILICVVVILVTAVGFLTVPKKNADFDAPETVPLLEEPSTLPTPTQVQPETEPSIDREPGEQEDAWANYPDGIQIEIYRGETFTAQVMLVRDPSKVYLATSTKAFAMETPGIRMDEALDRENAIAAMNAGSFYDDGSTSVAVGSVPCGLVVSESAAVWDSLHEIIPEDSFVGFNQDNILIVASSMTQAEARDLEIRDGCTSGPILVVNGNPNMDVYNANYGYTLRAAIGQRSDGTVLFVCTDGRTPDSIGADYSDMIDLLLAYGAVNACAMKDGSSANMLYRDVNGQYVEKGALQMFRAELRPMPTFWMVRAAG